MKAFQGTEVVAYHKQWEYLARWLGLKIVGYVEDRPGIPPAPRHVAEIIRRMNQRQIELLLVADFTNPSVPESVAQRAKARLIVLPTSVANKKGNETYGELFETIVTNLVDALK